LPPTQRMPSSSVPLEMLTMLSHNGSSKRLRKQLPKPTPLRWPCSDLRSRQISTISESPQLYTLPLISPKNSKISSSSWLSQMSMNCQSDSEVSIMSNSNNMKQPYVQQMSSYC